MGQFQIFRNRMQPRKNQPETINEKQQKTEEQDILSSVKLPPVNKGIAPVNQKTVKAKKSSSHYDAPNSGFRRTR
jgi:hypothetical protein